MLAVRARVEAMAISAEDIVSFALLFGIVELHGRVLLLGLRDLGELMGCRRHGEMCLFGA